MTELVLIPTYSNEWVLQFEWYLKAAGRSSSTRRIYAAALRQFARHVPDLMRPTRAQIHAWLRARRPMLAVASLNAEIYAMRAFYRWAQAMGCTDVDYSALLPRGKKPPHRLVRYLTDDQVGRLLAAPNLGTFVGFRDHVILRLAYETGLRASEIAALELGSVLTDRTLLVLSGKGVVDRYVPFSHELAALLEAWQQLRRTVRPGKSSILFVTHHGKAFRGGRSIWTIMDRYARRALGLARGFDRVRAEARRRPWSGLYPHLLRSSFATALIQNGCNLRAVQELLGHADVNTTARYIGVDLALLRREHRKLRLAFTERR